MNYIELINRFWEKDREYNFSDREIALYFYLLSVCNCLTWKNPFGQSNAMMAAKFGWGKSSLDTAKKKLKDVGLIDFKAGDGRGNVYQYEIKWLKKGNQKHILSDTLSEHLSDTLSGAKPETSINRNINKTKTEIPPLPPEGEVGVKNDFGFEEVWERYGKKGNRKTSEKKWAALKKSCREAALKHIPLYVQSTPDKQYRKNMETYLHQEAWNDEIIDKQSLKNENNTRVFIGAQNYGAATI